MPGTDQNEALIYSAAAPESPQVLLDRFLKNGGAALVTSAKPISRAGAAFISPPRVFPSTVLFISFCAIPAALWHCSRH
jgi:hypothetical protein